MIRERPAVRRPLPVVAAVCAALTLVLSSCAPSGAVGGPKAVRSTPRVDPTTGPTAPATATAVPTAQPTASPVTFGPNPQDFPAGINPLTGQPVADPALLKVPALLVSISHFPPTARPQAGLSFSPFVFEFSITEGETRFLTTFYGQYPAPEIPILGNCVMREGVFVRTGIVLGSRVWLDINKNGIQDANEPGIGGVCVNLYDSRGNVVQKTTTDSNGYYGFNVPKDETYTVQFVKPAYLDFSPPNVGDENHDSDADPSNGKTAGILITGDNLLVDAGMFPAPTYLTPTPNPATAPKPQVGPVRSGRLLYAYIGAFFQNSCLIDAFASSEVLPLIPHCAFVTHEVSGGGNMLDIDRMKAIAEDNMRHSAGRPFNYTSNVYSDTPPAGGTPASQIHVFFASLNQSAWNYDPLYKAYLRFVDTADKNAIGVLHPDVDRLTGRQLHFENVIVVMADTEVVSPTNLNIHLDAGSMGYAYLFRDGQMFPIRWSTRSGAYEQQTGFRRPIQFINSDGSAAPLKPGHSWVIIVTPFSTVKATQPGEFLVAYGAPEGEAR